MTNIRTVDFNFLFFRVIFKVSVRNSTKLPFVRAIYFSHQLSAQKLFRQSTNYCTSLPNILSFSLSLLLYILIHTAHAHLHSSKISRMYIFTCFFLPLYIIIYTGSKHETLCYTLPYNLFRENNLLYFFSSDTP